jgi:cob(I)alamin adenosyltransferase
MSAVKVYTRGGDRGETSLLSGGRVAKDHLRVEAYGSVDELCSCLGVLRCEPLPAGADGRLQQVQQTLFALGAALADPGGRSGMDGSSWEVEPLEAWIDEMEAGLEPLRSFILPGGIRAAAQAHMARAVCRRAERRVLSARDAEGGLPDGALVYLNRLSDALFVLARWLNAEAGVRDTPWRAAR